MTAVAVPFGGQRAPAVEDTRHDDLDWRYRARISDLFDHTASQRVLRAEVAAWIGDRDELHLLDVGCGDGRRTFELMDALGDRVAAVDWLDPAPLAMRRVREHASAYDRIAHRFVTGRIQGFHSAPGGYDCVLSLNSLFMPRSELSGVVTRLLSLTSPRGALFIELPRTLSTLHRLQLRTHYRLSGDPHLEVGRSTDALERLVALDIDVTEHISVETVRLSFPAGVAYRDLTSEQRRLVAWFNRGAPMPDTVNEFLVGELSARAVPVADHAAITSEVSLLVARPRRRHEEGT